ncbi:MAG: Tat pathway signal protein [Gemmatimonadaceae bacterium]
MVTRREFTCSVAAAGALVVLPSCSAGPDDEKYLAAVRTTWRHTNGKLDDSVAVQRELVRYATLAPSSHNTQCWKFRIEGDAISVVPDFARRCPAVDPDDHHLFVSLGCAAENLAQAALANGLHSEAAVLSSAEGGVRISLLATKPVTTPLFQAIPERQCTRADYDGRSISAEELRMLEAAGAGTGVQMMLFTQAADLENVLEFVVQANTAQMDDGAFVHELKEWIRFNAREAMRTNDGLHSTTTGNPAVPSWLGRAGFKMFFRTKSENDKYAKQVRNSAGVAVFIAEVADHAHWIEVGRSYERFALQATALGIRNAFLNQPVEMPAVRSQFATYLGVAGRRPDLVVRFGRGPRMPQSLCRPVQQVLV